jgi:hypothetical protein
MSPRRQTTRRTRRTTGEVGESRKRSLVTVPVTAILSRADERAAGRDERHFVLTTHYIDGQWTFTIEIEGEQWIVPGKVADRMRAHRDTIITEQRKLRAIDRSATIAAADQREAAEEAERDVALEAARALLDEADADAAEQQDLGL